MYLFMLHSVVTYYLYCSTELWGQIFVFGWTLKNAIQYSSYVNTLVLSLPYASQQVFQSPIGKTIISLKHSNISLTTYWI